MGGGCWCVGCRGDEVVEARWMDSPENATCEIVSARECVACAMEPCCAGPEICETRGKTSASEVCVSIAMAAALFGAAYAFGYVLRAACHRMTVFPGRIVPWSREELPTIEETRDPIPIPDRRKEIAIVTLPGGARCCGIRCE